MTIYSKHPNRGKIQILATFHGPSGVVSSTVTSVDALATAEPIVDALNRISACATVPVSVYDRRDNGFKHYPKGHLTALSNQQARPSLLDGAHSLWYELVQLRLHDAFAELDAALSTVPDPVRTAVAAELETEERNLREALAEYAEGGEIPEDSNRRYWDFEMPFVEFDGGMEDLSSETRERLDSLENGATRDQIKKAAADLRLITKAHARSTNKDAILVAQEMIISYDPPSPDLYFLDILAPLPNGLHRRKEWVVDLSQWDKDLDAPGNEDSTATGQLVLRCARPQPPEVTEIVDLLNLSTQRGQLTNWSNTPTGEKLQGTTFTVTEREDD